MEMVARTAMPFDEDSLVSPSTANAAVYCSGECYRQCTPESCPGLTTQCTDKCVVVTCSDPHDSHDQPVCGDIVCDDQDCTDPTDCHGVYEFLQCCDDYHDYFYQPKPHNLDHTTATTFSETGWDSAFDALLQQGYQDGHLPVGCYEGMSTSPLALTSGAVAAMTVSSSRSPTPSTPSAGHSRHHSYTHPEVLQQGHPQQHIANPPPPFHNLNQPDEGLSFESNSPDSRHLSSVQSQSHLAVGQTEATGTHPCMWANCHAAFGSLQDLVAHVNVQHLQTVSASLTANNQLDPSQGSASSYHQSSLNPTGQVFPSCHWGGCDVYPNVENVPSSSDRPFDAALGVLAAHLWQYHLGLPTPPPQFSFAAATPLLAEDGAESTNSPSLEDVSSKVQASPVEVEMIEIPHPFSASSVTTGADPVVMEVVNPGFGTGSCSSNAHPAGSIQDQEHAHDQGHDCATSDHPCKWSDCQERFASCEALMTHITAEHVGSGKNYYGCFWDGCGRNGEKGFKSKQKICRHLQSHTGHRPHQCEVCQQCFSEAATLQQHMRRHTQEKPYECDHPGCGKRFAIMGALTIHKRTHNGDKPFKCSQCDKAFSESSNLSKHLRTHTGARPYVCPEPGCGKSFGRGDQLTRHLNVHSGGGKVVKRATAVPTTKVD